MEVKDIIKQRRLELGLTLDDVARMVGVSGATISRWESGDIANMKRDKIVSLANALQISPSVIMGWDGPSDEPEPPYIPQTIAAHFDGEEFTEDELDEISSFIEFVKAKKKGKK